MIVYLLSKGFLSFESDDGKNKHLYIPRIKSWDGQVKETDLEVVIKSAAIRHRKGDYEDTAIVKYLLDCYSDNVTKTSNLIYTVTKAIPLLYEHQLELFWY